MRILCLSFLMCALAIAAPDYQRDVVPILRDYCVGCHNGRELDGEFSVETFANLRAGGESGQSVLEPGNADESFLIRTLLKQEKPAMPPRKEPQPSKAEIAVLEEWINAGAHGPAATDDKSMLDVLAVPEVAAAKLQKEPITALAASPDGKRLALARFGRIDLLSSADFAPAGGFPVEEGKINAIHWSPDGSRLITAGGIPGLKGIATVRDVATGAVVLAIGEGHRDVLYDAEWAPDGALIATAGYDQVIRVWDGASGKLVREIPGHNGAVFDLAFSPNGKLLASASGDQTSKVWRVSDGERLDTLNQPQGAQFRIAFTPDGKHLLGAGADNRIRLWRLLSVDTPEINPVLQARFSHEAEVVQFAFDPAGKQLLSASADGTVKLWTLPELRLVADWPGHHEVASGIAWVDGFVATTLEGSVDRYAAEATGSTAGKASSLTKPVAVATGAMTMAAETEETGPQPVVLPVTVKGRIERAGDVDEFRFEAKAGQEWVIEVLAARNKSPLDSKVEVVTEGGQPVERAVLQALRDSWFTFRGKDSNTSDDFRVNNWREMEVNEFLYCNGEVVKLWHYPRGPDSGFRVYPGVGNRQTWFDTSPLSHAMGEPCYIVEPWPAGTQPLPNGLPVYHLFFENDDDASRRFGKDSKLTFTAPADGVYLARIRDVRGLGGENHNYELAIRPTAPDFTVAIDGKDAKVSPGSGKELTFRVTREDGFAGEIELNMENLPPGFSAGVPTTIEAGQERALVALHAAADAPAVTEAMARKIRVVAKAKIGERQVEKSLGDLGKLTLGPAPKVVAEVLPGATAEAGSVILTIHPGETITARVAVQRNGFPGQVDFGKDDAGRNLPHGVYVDNIGLNGLMIPEGLLEQRFAITAAKWVQPTERWFHLHSTADGGQSTIPVRIRVVE